MRRDGSEEPSRSFARVVVILSVVVLLALLGVLVLVELGWIAG